jgi:hypothetical protein
VFGRGLDKKYHRLPQRSGLLYGYPSVHGADSPEIKLPDGGTDHTSPSTAGSKNPWSHTLHSPIRLHSAVRNSSCCGSVRFEVVTAVTMKNAVYWDVSSCGFLRTDVSEERITSIIRMTEIG